MTTPPARRSSVRRITLSSAAVALLVTLAACQDGLQPPSPGHSPDVASLASTQGGGVSLQNQYIVLLTDETGDVRGKSTQLAGTHGASMRHTYSHAVKGFAATMTPGAAAALARDPSVVLVEQEQVFTLAGTQSGAPWGLDRIDQSTLPLDGNFTYANTGAGVNVYIIDSGIRRTHVQFGGRVVPAFSAIADGNGPDGCHWHGSHVAGVIGSTGYGVAKGAALHSVRAYDCSGVGTTSGILAAVDWVTANRVLPAVANMSIQGPLSSAVNTAVQNSINSGITYVVAAGNNAGQSACNYSPASVGAALTVAAIGGGDKQASYSNVGSCVDLYAPGTQIYSPTNKDDAIVELFSGTSQAAGFVAGAAAVYLAGNPSASPGAVAQAIVSGATSGVVNHVSPGTPNRLLRMIGTGGPVTPPSTGNAAPVASFTFACSKANCSFDGSSSTDDVGIVRYDWTFGDGTTASGSTPKVSKSYSTRTNITVTVALKVTDAGALSSTTQKSVSIKVKGK